MLAAITGGIGVAVQGKGYAGIAGGAILLVLAWLSVRFRDPAELRKARVGAVLYLAPALAMLIGGAVALAAPQSAAPKPDAERKQQIEKRRAEQRQEVAAEARVMSSGAYAEAVEFRREHYLKDYAQQGGFTMLVLGLFLLGAWFVQSGAILHPERHEGLFRKLLWIGLPLGLALAVIGHFIAPSHVPGQNDKPWQFAIGLQMVGNLPMSLSYIAAIVLLLQQRNVWARLLSWLAPAGRMALTNYLSQSVIASLFFYGYGLGHWGAGRAWQALFVIVVFALQLLISRWWLSRFRYGPMEWLWRWATYGRRPAMAI